MKTFPPAYTVRRSARARRPLLRALPGKGLEVVLPLWAADSLVPDILTRHRAWIERALARDAEGRRENGAQDGAFPFCFGIRGGSEWLVLRPTGRNARLCEVEPALFEPPEGAGRLPRRELALRAFAGDLREHPAKALELLREALRAEAGRLLFPLLEDLASTHGFSHTPGRVRFQSSRWGSCSSKGAINLNAALIFLPDHLIRHVLLHELCHTKELNHSERYWKLLFAANPQALDHDRELRRARAGWVPDWAWG